MDVSPSRSGVWAHAAAGAWGLAEATYFFLVPDVLLTWLALDDARRAWWACVWATLGAVIGGVIMYNAGAAAPKATLGSLDHVPAVSVEMIDRVGEQVRQRGAASVFIGPITGTPYKLYAAHAGDQRVSLAAFVTVSVPARLIRFVLLVGLVLGLRRVWPRVDLRRRRIWHAACWGVFYVGYYTFMAA